MIRDGGYHVDGKISRGRTNRACCTSAWKKKMLVEQRINFFKMATKKVADVAHERRITI
jgi:hypothetical protein